MQDDIKKLGSVAVVYLLVIPSIFLHFFWKHFGVEPFEYISVSDSISYAFQPFLLAVITLLPIFINVAIISKPDHPDHTSSDKWLPDGMALLLIVVGNLYIVLAAEVGMEIGTLMFWVIFVFVLICALILSSENTVKNTLKNKSAGIFLALFLSLSPMYTVHMANSMAESALDERWCRYLSGEMIKGNLEDESEKLIYIGKLASSYIFVRESTEEVVIHGESNIQYLLLNHCKCNKSSNADGDKAAAGS